jgi:hypothetical protein
MLLCAVFSMSEYAPLVTFFARLARCFVSGHLQVLGLPPDADVGGYLLVHGNVAALTLNHISRISLVQCNNCTRSYTQVVYFMKLLVTFAIDIGNSRGLTYL